MTPDDIRKKYLPPEQLGEELTWVFHLKMFPRGIHSLAIIFDAREREFVAVPMTVEGPSGPSVQVLGSTDRAVLRSLLPAAAIAQCTAASLQLEPPQL